MGAGRNPKATATISPNEVEIPRGAGIFVIRSKSPGAQRELSSDTALTINHVKHKGGQTAKLHETKPRITPIRTVKGRIGRWMADTGASIDAIDLNLVSKAGRRKVRKLHNQMTYETLEVMLLQTVPSN